MIERKYIFRTIAASVMVSMTSGAQAVDLTFTGNLINSCVLAVTQQGTLVPTTDGRTISSEASGGAPATLTVVAVGLNPSIHFTAPSLTSPGGWTGSPTTSMRYQSSAGASQAYTSSATTVTTGALLDTFTVNSKVDNTLGFAGGQYVVRTTVTCQQ